MIQRWFWMIFVLLAVLVAVDIAYRVCDEGSSPEILRGGLQFPAQDVSSEVVEAEFVFPENSRYLEFRGVCDYATEGVMEEARAGIPGVLTIEAPKMNRTWQIPILLTVTEEGVQHRSAVIAASASASEEGEVMGLGFNYRLDYQLQPTSLGEDTYNDLFWTEFPEGTKLRFKMELQSKPGPGTKLYVAYSRLPRYLHQVLF